MKNKQIEGIVELSRNGHAYLKNETYKDGLFINKKNAGQALDGDLVNIELIPDESGKGADVQGKVVGIVTRNKIDFSGVIDINEEKSHAFVRTSGNGMPVDFYVPMEQLNGAKNGDIVVVRLQRWNKKEKNPTGIVVKVIGKPETHEAEMGSIMFKHGIDYTFPPEVDAEANAIPVEIPESEILKRRDMRDVLTFTIDGADAKDLDDALSFKVLDSGNYEIGVHIADIGHYVKRGSEIDKEALRRGTSVYLVDRCIPMLPEKLSNNLASLNPNTDKLTVSTIFEITPEGQILNYKFKKTVINSNYRFTYEEVQKIIEDGIDADLDWKLDIKLSFVELTQAILTLDKIAKKIRTKRFENGSVYFNSKEPKFILDDNDFPIDIKFSKLKDSNQLIEEFMLLTNRYVGSFLYKNKILAAFRVHDSPNAEKLLELSLLVKQFGYNLKAEGNIEDVKNSLNNLLAEVKDTPEESMISTLAVRCMSKAKVSPINIGHYGLGKDFMPPNAYTWFTSGIRRYADIINQRQLFNFLDNKKGKI